MRSSTNVSLHKIAHCNSFATRFGCTWAGSCRRWKDADQPGTVQPSADGVCMIAQECPPGLRWRPSAPDHVLGDSGLGDLKPELEHRYSQARAPSFALTRVAATWPADSAQEGSWWIRATATAPSNQSRKPSLDFFLVRRADLHGRMPGVLASSTGKQRFEGLVEVPLQFKPNTRNGRRLHTSVRDHHVIAVPAEGLEAERVDLGAAEAECGRDMQAEEMAAMRPERRPWAAIGPVYRDATAARLSKSSGSQMSSNHQSP
jgi:hypothetical protein